MSTRYNTQNPIESDDVRDMSDNAKNLDIFSNSSELSFDDRLGIERKTIHGMNSEFDAQIVGMNSEFDAKILNMGFTRVGTFATGGTLTNPRQTLLWDVADGGDGQEYGWSGSFPLAGKVVPPGSTPLTTGGIAVGAWMSRFDPELRIQVRESLRRSYAEAGYNLVDGSFEVGGTLANANDVLLQERTGKAFSGPAGTVAAGTNPASGGFVDRSSYLLKAQLGAVSILEFDKDADLGYPHDAHPAWLKAKATGKQVIFPKPRNRYYMQGPMILEQNSIIGSGVGQAYGNTAVVVEFGGFTADYAVESKTKMNRFDGFYFTPRSWDPVSGFVGAGLKQAAMTVGIDSAFVGFKDGGHRISVSPSNITTETWLSRYVRCSFEFNGKHGAHYKDAGNGTSFIDCNGRWNGAPAFMVQPTVQSVWDGINIESDSPSGPSSRPEGFYLSGGDWSYNSRYGFDVQSGTGGAMNPGYIELNLKNGGRVGGIAKGWKVRPLHVGQSIERNIESLFQTPLTGTIAKMPNQIDAGGVPLGTGALYGDNATTIPIRELASDGAMHKILTYNWSGVWGSILRLMNKTGDMVYRAASADNRVMNLYLDKVRLEDQQWNDKTHKLVARVAREVTGLPTASAEYQNTMLFNVVDRKLYFCFYNSTDFVWRQVSLV